MPLSDAQIDRFSRQIILPQIGGVGQERLLQSSVAVAGDGELAAITALYLVSAGVGRIALHRSHRLSAELCDLNPEVQVTLASGALGSVDADVLIACDLALAEIDRAALSGLPVVAGAIDDSCGWLVVAQAATACASCAARQALRVPASPRSASLRSAIAGVVGSLMALAVLKLRLGLHPPASREWLQFDAAGSTLTAQPVTRAADCPACTVA